MDVCADDKEKEKRNTEKMYFEFTRENILLHKSYWIELSTEVNIHDGGMTLLLC